jgi:hypothetical protein
LYRCKKVVPLNYKKSLKESRDIIQPLLNFGARKGGWSTPRPGRFIPKKERRYSPYKIPGGNRGRSG